MKHIFIVNPAAGKGKSLTFIPRIKELFNEMHEELVIEITKAPGHAEEIARKYCRESGCRIYSVGGDGTLNEVLNGLIGGVCGLAVIPCGTGNDFIRTVSNGWDDDSILKRTVTGDERHIDAAVVNGRYFINIASVGFDAQVVYNAQRFKRIPLLSGSASYVLGILAAIFSYRGENMSISLDGKTIKGKFLLAAIANGRYYGGGMLPAPSAKIDDGLLELCLVKAMSRAKILVLFPRYMKGRHESMKEVLLSSSRRISILCTREASVNIDGEVIRSSRIDMEIIPQAVRIVVPAGVGAHTGADASPVKASV